MSSYMGNTTTITIPPLGGTPKEIPEEIRVLKTKFFVNEMHKAMLEAEAAKVVVMREIMAGIQTLEKSGKTFKEASYEDIQKVLHRIVKEHMESLDAYIKAERKEAIKQEEKMLGLLSLYLPKPLGQEEVRKIILATLETMESPTFAQVMQAVAPQLQGRADMTLVVVLVKEILKNYGN